MLAAFLLIAFPNIAIGSQAIEHAVALIWHGFPVVSC